MNMLLISSNQGRLQRWRSALVVMHSFATAAPTLLLSSLFLLSLYGAALIGHWPLPGADDPKFIGSGDPLYQVLWLFSQTLLYWAVSSLLLWPVLTLLLWRVYRWQTHLQLAALHALGWLAVWADPVQRLRWWFD